MKKLLLVMLSSLTLSSAMACDDIKTTAAIVDYVCDYSLVSDTQCRVWTEDVRQMNNNQKIIHDSFISWTNELNEMGEMFASNSKQFLSD